MDKLKVLIIQTGGTVSQKRTSEGVLEPSTDPYLHLVHGLDDVAKYDILDLGSIDSTNMKTSALTN